VQYSLGIIIGNANCGSTCHRCWGCDFHGAGRLLIHLGDSDIDYDPTFRLYMSTKLPNPHYLPEVCIKVTVINFTVTMFGLEDQLLGAVVKKERPDIETKKNRLVVSMASDKKQLQVRCWLCTLLLSMLLRWSCLALWCSLVCHVWSYEMPPVPLWPLANGLLLP
jgi:hypothetical protein